LPPACSLSQRLGPPPEKEFSGHLICSTNSGAPLMQKKKKINKTRTYTHNPPSQSEDTDRIRARIDFLLIITRPNHNSLPKTQTKNTDRSINSHLSDSPISLCEVAVGALSYQSLFFMTSSTCDRYSPSIDCIQMRSIN